jgi:hypothetical protein
VGSIKGCVILFKGEIDGWTFGWSVELFEGFSKNVFSL